MSDLTPTPADRAELVHYDAWRERMTLWQTAKGIAEPTNSICPSDLRGKTGAVFQILLMGQALGIEPMQALMQMHVIKGKVGLSAQLMRAMILRAGHRLTYVQRSDTTCTIRGKRRDTGDELEVTWTLEMAREVQASDESAKMLTDKTNWTNYPRAMLDARATTELARALFPDVIAWASYTPEELGDEQGGDDEA